MIKFIWDKIAFIILIFGLVWIIIDIFIIPQINDVIPIHWGVGFILLLISSTMFLFIKTNFPDRSLR